ncbi:hypothetical protein JCM3774_004129 [Rhodotorula dairenensis]
MAAKSQPHQPDTTNIPPPLYDPPISTPHDTAAAAEETYPPTSVRESPSKPPPVADHAGPGTGIDASKLDEERGLLDGDAGGGEARREDEGIRRAGTLDTLLLPGKDWRRLWRENRRVILIRIFCIVVTVFALAGLICGTIANRAEHAVNPVAPALLVDPLVP